MSFIAAAASQGSTAPAFDDLMIAMDAVDTLRHENMLIESELSADERRNVLVDKLKAYYSSQGITVADEILERAVDEMDRNRFVHEPMKPGLTRVLASAYVRRWRYGRNAVAAAVLATAAFVAMDFTYSELVVKPAARAEKALMEALQTTLPMRLADAHSGAVAAAGKLGDSEAAKRADTMRDAAILLIDTRDADGASKKIDELETFRDGLLKRVLSIRYASEAESILADVDTAGWDTRAAAAYDGAKERLLKEASAGDAYAFEAAKKNLADLVRLIGSGLTLRIVDREGIRSGVWRTNDGGRTRVHYIIVEAVDAAGQTVAMDIENVETGRTERVDHWGIRVPVKVYDRVAHDKQSDGIIDDRQAGMKPAGSLDFRWDIPVSGGMITRW